MTVRLDTAVVMLAGGDSALQLVPTVNCTSFDWTLVRAAALTLKTRVKYVPFGTLGATRIGAALWVITVATFEPPE